VPMYASPGPFVSMNLGILRLRVVCRHLPSGSLIRGNPE
jgi:hypothetical protein